MAAQAGGDFAPVALTATIFATTVPQLVLGHVLSVTIEEHGTMSRGPGVVERGVLDALARYGPMNATELAQDIFGLWERLELEPTLAQLGSVQRAIRHLAARGVIVEYYSGRKYWQLPEPEKRGSWSEEIFRLLATPKIWRKTKDCLAIAPARDIDRIAGSDKQRLPITGDPT